MLRYPDLADTTLQFDQVTLRLIYFRRQHAGQSGLRSEVEPAVKGGSFQVMSPPASTNFNMEGWQANEAREYTSVASEQRLGKLPNRKGVENGPCIRNWGLSHV